MANLVIIDGASASKYLKETGAGTNGDPFVPSVIVDSGTVAATQSGTWTVQPGNTANTTAWKVDGSAVTQPISGTVTANAGTGTFAVSAASLPLPSGAATSAKQDTGNTSVASIDTKTPALGQALAAASVPVVLTATQLTSLTAPVLAAGSAIVGKVGIDQTTPGTTNAVAVTTTAYTSQPTVTRPANQTAYTANDVVGGAITFTSAGPTSGSVMITGGDLRLDISAIPSGMTSFRLYLYNVTPPSALADNAAWDLSSGDRASFLGYIDMGTPVDLGSTCYVQVDNVNRKVLLAASTSLFGYLVTAGAFTPAANSEVYTPRLQTIGV